MIYALFSLFLILALGLGLALSYELRAKLAGFFVGLIPQGKQRFQSARHFAQHADEQSNLRLLRHLRRM
jgi:peptidoglycan L-alanyl-D-glutamate endopeptidase CwlK